MIIYDFQSHHLPHLPVVAQEELEAVHGLEGQIVVVVDKVGLKDVVMFFSFPSDFLLRLWWLGSTQQKEHQSFMPLQSINFVAPRPGT